MLQPGEVRSSTGTLRDESLSRLDAGEEAAIVLAVELHADLLLMDDREGVIAARGKGFRVAGTLAVLSMAAQRDLLTWISTWTNNPAKRSAREQLESAAAFSTQSNSA